MLYKTVVAASIVSASGLAIGSASTNAAVRSGSVSMAAKQVPHGGKLVDLFVPEADVAALAATATKTIEITERQSCDVQLLCNGGLSPLTGFLGEEAYKGVVETMKLPDGNIMGLPIVMDTDDASIAAGDKLLLQFNGTPMALMTVEDKFSPDKPLECIKCYGTATIEHPGVRMVSMERGQYYLGGSIQGLQTPVRDFPCATPAEVREMLPSDVDVVAFQCRNPVHRAHYELFTRALDAPNVGEGAVVLVHPTCGPTQEDDIPGNVRHKTYEVLIEETKETPSGKRTEWAYLPYSMHMAGPREAIQHMLIRKNFGCTHFIIGRDMAGSKSVCDLPTSPHISPHLPASPRIASNISTSSPASAHISPHLPCDALVSRLTARISTAPSKPRTSPRRTRRSWVCSPCPRSTSCASATRPPSSTSPRRRPRRAAPRPRSSRAPSSARCCVRARRSRSGSPSSRSSRSSAPSGSKRASTHISFADLDTSRSDHQTRRVDPNAEGGV